MTTSSRPTAATTPTGFTPTTDTRFAVDDALLARASALGPTIREHADETERDRRLARPVLDAMRDAGLFRMFTPRALGGSETDPVTVARVAEEIASHDSAAAWALREQTIQDKADLMLACTQAVHAAAQVTDLVHRVTGTSGIYSRSRLERHFRDAQTVRHHGFLCESRYETVGQVYLGVEPEFAFVAF